MRAGRGMQGVLCWPRKESPDPFMPEKLANKSIRVNQEQKKGKTPTEEQSTCVK